MKIGVFCSANNTIDSDYFVLTEELGRWIAANGHTLVFGGCNTGLMECVAKAVHAGGGRTIGIVPTLVERGGRKSDEVDIEFRCDNLDDRKAMLVAQSDIMVALPGGIGTLDEVFTAAAAATIGYHGKIVVLYNMKGFWQPLVTMLDSLADSGVIRGEWRDHIMVADTLEGVVDIILKTKN